MYVSEVVLSNVRIHKDVTFRLTPGLNLILGPNGAGKSTVLMAIGWALFDYLPLKQAQFVTVGEQQASVDVKVVVRRGKELVVTRGTRTGMVVYDNGLPIARGKADSLVAIRGALGLPSDKDLSALFRDAVGPRQGSLLEGFGLAPAARFDYWGSTLRLDGYRRAWERLRETRRYLLDQGKEIEKVTEGHKVVLSTLDVPMEIAELDGRLHAEEKRKEELSVEIGVWVKEKAELSEELAGAVEQNKQHDDLVLRRDFALSTLEDIEKRVVEIKREKVEHQGEQELIVLRLGELSFDGTLLESYASAKTELDGVSVMAESLEAQWWVSECELQKGEKMRVTVSQHEQDLFDVTLELAAKKDKFEELTIHQTVAMTEIEYLERLHIDPGKPCPTCGVLLSGENAEEIIKGNEQKLCELESLKSACLMERMALKKGMEGLISSERVMQAYLREVPSQESVEQLRALVEERKAALDKLRAREKELVEFVEGHKEQVAQHIQDRQEYNRLRERAGVLKGRVELLGRQLANQKTLREREQRKIPEGIPPAVPVDGMKERLAEIDSARESSLLRMEQIGQVIENLLKAKPHVVGLLEHGQEVKVCKEAIEVLERCRQGISDAGPVMAERVMRHVSSLAGQSWTNMGKAGYMGWNGEFELSVDELPFSMLSGGEQVLAALSARMAVARYMADVDLGWLVLDEPSVHLDEAARQGLVDVLSCLGLEQMLVVTHDDTFASSADNVIPFGITL